MTVAGRNDPCPCGSGAKYKKCCLGKERGDAGTRPVATFDNAVDLHRAGHIEKAEAAYRQILEHKPRNADALHLLGVARMQLGDLPQAVDLIRQAIDIGGPQRDSLYNLGNALRGLRREEEAADAYRRALEISPNDAIVLNNLGLAYRGMRAHERAAECYVRALKLAPEDIDLHINLGLALIDLHHVDEAIAQYRSALAIAPNHPELCNNLGVALSAGGDTAAAIPLFETAMRARPDYVEAHSNLIYCLDFIEEDGASRQQAERRRWAAVHTRDISRFTHHDNAPVPDRRLRIGYVSADFRRHSAAYAFAPLLFDYDRDRFDVFCYSNSTTNDDMTQKMRAAASGWRDIYALPDDAVANLVRQDGIDILVDLAGHARDNRLLVFARKPAPIQATGWGHANGTGMTEIDVMFSDPIYIPPEEAALYAESLAYLQCFLCYVADEGAPDVAPLPALAAGHITFGCFSRFAKITAEALDLWCEVLRALPDSRIVFKAAELNSPDKRAWLLDQLAGRAIDGGRVTLLGWTPWHEHLAAMMNVDIMLDTFPHSGGVGVLDSLWMGVPVLSLKRPIPTGRIAASILTVAGMTDWIAESKEDYLDIASRQSRDRAALAALRRELRARVSNSPLGDSRAYAHAVEVEYRKLWQSWCARQAGM